VKARVRVRTLSESAPASAEGPRGTLGGEMVPGSMSYDMSVIKQGLALDSAGLPGSVLKLTSLS